MSVDAQKDAKISSIKPVTDSPQKIVQKYLTTKDLKELPTEQISLPAHTLRTTLTIIRNYLWVIMYQKDQEIAPKVRRNLTIIKYATEYLNNLIENTLTVNKLDLGNLQIVKEEVDLVKVVEGALARHSTKAAECGIALALSPSVQVAVTKLDVRRTVDILDRLIDNAIKFTPPQGKISFKVSDSDDEQYYEVSVSDSGPGIDKTAQKDLFKKFGRIEKSYANLESDDGSGLGLYIASKYAQLQGGKIVVQSDSGAGATFVVSLPKI